MSATGFHTALIARLDFLHSLFLDKTTGLQATQFEPIVPGRNHANWLIGHHLWEKDVLLCEWPGGTILRPPGLDALYSFGTTLQPAKAYPGCEELRTNIDSLHAEMLATLTPDNLTLRGVGTPDELPTRLDCVLHFIHDASYHLGQLSMRS